MSAPDGPVHWRVSDVIDGRYEVKRVAGAGGMGQVLQVRHLQWGIDLAVKCPKADWFETAAQRELFVAEAEAWVSLGLHPNLTGPTNVDKRGHVDGMTPTDYPDNR